MKKISVIVGSLRKASYAGRIANNVLKMFPSDWDVKIVEIRDLPLYDCDYDDPKVTEKPLPEIYKEFRATLKSSDGVFFVTAENNRLLPASVKNAIDICSKPNDDVAFKEKPVGVISHSVGKMGGYSSQKSLKLALSYFNPKFLGQPEVFIGNSNKYFDGDSEEINNQGTIDFIQSYVDRFVKLVEEK